MGFDLYGVKPNNEPIPDNPDWDDSEQCRAYFAWQKNTDGAYFRANVWTWHPIWDFVYIKCRDILEEHLEDMDSSSVENISAACHHNDGFLIPEVVSKKIAQRLFELDSLGVIDAEEVSDDLKRENTPLKKCKHCKGTGTRAGWEGWESEKEWLKTHKSLQAKYNESKEHELQVDYTWAHEMKGCNACHGKGSIAPFSLSYRFVADMVREFASFCDKSGGFTVS